MSGGKHADYSGEYRTINYKKVVLVIVIFLLLFGIGFGSVLLVKHIKNKPKEEPTPVETGIMPEEIEGFKVLGEFEFETLGINQYILDSYDDKALEKGIGKLYGGNLNSIGNFAVVGHNYDNVFGKLFEINKGDTYSVKEPDGDVTKYQVTEINTIEPTDLTVLTQNTDKCVMTLITCDTEGTQRFVVKAEKVTETETDETTSNKV